MLIRPRFTEAQNQQKGYTDHRSKDLEFANEIKYF